MDLDFDLAELFDVLLDAYNYMDSIHLSLGSFDVTLLQIYLIAVGSSSILEFLSEWFYFDAPDSDD